MAVEYFVIISAFFPFYLVLGAINSMIRADGSPTFAMIGTLVGAVINVILDPVFIFLFKWGIAGAAWATVIGQVVYFTVCMIYFLRPKTFKLSWKSFIPDWQICRSMVSLGASTFVTQLSIVVISLVCNMTLIFGSGNELYYDFAVKTFRIYLSLMTFTCLTKMTSVFFQAIGKPMKAVAASLVRDIVCFTPIAIFLPAILEGREAGTGIYGILFAAPAADIIVLIVIICITVPFLWP